jgi:hypothetical protein
MITVGWIKIRDNTYVTLYVLTFNLNGCAPYTAGMYGVIRPGRLESHQGYPAPTNFCRAAEIGKELVLLFLSSFPLPFFLHLSTATFYVFISILINGLS